MLNKIKFCKKIFRFVEMVDHINLDLYVSLETSFFFCFCFQIMRNKHFMMNCCSTVVGITPYFAYLTVLQKKSHKIGFLFSVCIHSYFWYESCVFRLEKIFLESIRSLCCGAVFFHSTNHQYRILSRGNDALSREATQSEMFLPCP